MEPETMSFICQNCGAYHPHVQIQQEKASRILWNSTWSCSGNNLALGYQEQNQEKQYYIRTFWQCKICDKKHTINVEKIEENSK